MTHATPRHILVCIAWPYANADIHQGNVTGSHLPGDIHARYHRLRGNHVLMVSGSDTHGTPVTVKADELGLPVQKVYEHYHSRFLELFVRLGISYDLYTHTDTHNHHRVSQDIFSALHAGGYLYRQVSQQMYSPSADRFLPDRMVEGTCPKCGYTGARGDQCDQCNTLFDSPAELIEPRSKLDSSTLELRDTEHFYLDLPKLAAEGLEEWLATDKDHWRPNVLNFSRSFVGEGLLGRPITRDMDWGIPIPAAGSDLPGYENKVLYVWFEAVIGYFSAPIEWSQHQGTPDAWKAWWYNPEARTTYFIGKDNIPFHTVIWPAELLGVKRLYTDDPAARLNLPWDVPATAFMNMEGRKISGSRNWGVWMLDALERHDPDPLRYYLTVQMPEARDSDWSWQGYVERNNNELVANWGNLVNRTLNMTQRYCDGVVPEPGDLTAADEALLAAVDAAFGSAGALFEGSQFRAAVQELLQLSTRVNQYLEEMSPWKTAKTDLQATRRTLWVVLQAINGLKVLWAPVLPFTSQQLHTLLGAEGTLFGRSHLITADEAGRTHTALTYDPDGAIGRWERSPVPAGRQLPKPEPLFRKLDPEQVVADELSRLGQRPAD
jgi:methionyl-tRNA synthetase